MAIYLMFWILVSSMFNVFGRPSIYLRFSSKRSIYFRSMLLVWFAVLTEIWSSLLGEGRKEGGSTSNSDRI